MGLVQHGLAVLHFHLSRLSLNFDVDVYQCFLDHQHFLCNVEGANALCQVVKIKYNTGQKSPFNGKVYLNS